MSTLSIVFTREFFCRRALLLTFSVHIVCYYQAFFSRDAFFVLSLISIRFVLLMYQSVAFSSSSSAIFLKSLRNTAAWQSIMTLQWMASRMAANDLEFLDKLLMHLWPIPRSFNVTLWQWSEQSTWRYRYLYKNSSNSREFLLISVYHWNSLLFDVKAPKSLRDVFTYDFCV